MRQIFAHLVSDLTVPLYLDFVTVWREPDRLLLRWLTNVGVIGCRFTRTDTPESASIH